jgi:hypothetical protein
VACVIRLGTELQTDTYSYCSPRARAHSLADYDLLMKCAKVFYLITTPVEFHMRLHSLPPLLQLYKRQREERGARRSQMVTNQFHVHFCV